ncbi:hypothetical protein O6H91_16G066500 [Diphasiastrum complanatum]|uniref:Uncharacterized protein n=1 Tax=Diphasiastrum complanatum TaxID=34168 RepID=A0ACC2BCZ7_DIPCM|nr:hypothetical protein O6H91_16G066500 [Diphasiastrum complanatum]
MGVVERSREVMAVMVLHEALRSVCLNSEWNYAVFWTIRPRPRSRGGMGYKAGDEGSLMLMWEDGFCQSMTCVSSVNHVDTSNEDPEGVLRASVTCNFVEDGEEEDPVKRAFRKMSIQLYNYGEGLMGKVASDKCHKWVFRESPESEVVPMNYWQSSFDSHPPEWTDQFSAGIQIAEDLHFVLRMRYTFESVESQSGSFLSQSFAPMRSRFFSGSPTASPSFWPQNHTSLLQGSDCKLRLGFSNEASTQELFLQRHNSKLPNQNDAVPSTSEAHRSPGYKKIKIADDAVDNNQGFTSPGVKRLTGTLFSERPPPFIRDRLTQGMLIKSNPGSPRRTTQATQNLLTEASRTPSFPISAMLSPSTKTSAAYEGFHVRLPEASDTAAGNLTMAGAPSSLAWSVSLSSSFEPQPQQEQEKLGSPNTNIQSLTLLSRNPFEKSYSNASDHQNGALNLSQCQKDSLERPHFSDPKSYDWLSQTHPDGDLMVPLVWGDLKVPPLDTLDCHSISLQMNGRCGSGDICSFMESLFD